MNAADGDSTSRAGLDHVLVAAPFRRDAAFLKETLARYRIDVTNCADADDLDRELNSDAAAVILSQEALTSQVIGALAQHLAAQPGWSELPLILLLDARQQTGAVLATLRASLPRSKLTVLQRPVRALELVTAVQTAIAARRRQFQLRDHIVWQEELQRELNHRVKNVMASVMAIYHMTRRQSASLEDFSASFEGRLSALSRVHDVVVASGEARPMVEIAELVLAPYRADAGKRLEIEGPAINVAAQNTVTLALCLHEFATNAAKYGALSQSQGRVSLTWTIERDRAAPAVQLRWTETGGPPVRVPSRRGYGTSFIRSAIKGMGGVINFDFKAEGLLCVIELPLTGFEAHLLQGEAAPLEPDRR